MSLTAIDVHQPKSKPRALLLFLHGVGASERAMLPLAQAAPEEYLTQTLRAPFALSPYAFAWFHVQFRENGPAIEEEEARTSLQELRAYILQLRETHGDLPIYLVGFSQGAIMSLLLSLIYPGLVDGAICFSGRLPKEFSGDLVTQTPEKNTALWIGHGVQDSVLRIQYARDIKALLDSSAIPLSYQEYTAGHEVTPQMLQDAYEWLAAQIKQ
ncbi:MAG: hypothetical protein PW735_03305 [Acidobacteriaceae bacterium]|nr:hypothetical protein [Acidobacteriaceae bacterium]